MIKMTLETLLEENRSEQEDNRSEEENDKHFQKEQLEYIRDNADDIDPEVLIDHAEKCYDQHNAHGKLGLSIIWTIVKTSQTEAVGLSEKQ